MKVSTIFGCLYVNSYLLQAKGWSQDCPLALWWEWYYGGLFRHHLRFQSQFSCWPLKKELVHDAATISPFSRTKPCQLQWLLSIFRAPSSGKTELFRDFPIFTSALICEPHFWTPALASKLLCSVWHSIHGICKVSSAITFLFLRHFLKVVQAPHTLYNKNYLLFIQHHSRFRSSFSSWTFQEQWCCNNFWLVWIKLAKNAFFCNFYNAR